MEHILPIHVETHYDTPGFVLHGVGIMLFRRARRKTLYLAGGQYCSTQNAYQSAVAHHEHLLDV